MEVDAPLGPNGCLSLTRIENMGVTVLPLTVSGFCYLALALPPSRRRSFSLVDRSLENEETRT